MKNKKKFHFLSETVKYKGKYKDKQTDKEKENKKEDNHGKEDNENNVKKLVSWTEAYQINSRAFQLIYKENPSMMISRLLCVVWEALTPYVGIYFSALIVGELAGNKDMGRLKELVLITLLSQAGISLISAFLSKWRNTQSCAVYYQVEKIYTKKLMEMDFVHIDNAKIHEQLYKIQQNQRGGGWGLFKVIFDYEAIVSAIFTLFGGITLTVSLFTSAVPEQGGKYTILNNPLFLVLVIFSMLAVTYISPVLTNKAGSYWAMNSDVHNLANRLFGHFGWLGSRWKFAADVRMYRQDIICDKYNGNKEGAFCSKGIFSRYFAGIAGLYHGAAAGISVIFTGIVYLFVCLKAWAGAFGIGAVTQYIASITKVSSGVSSLILMAGSMRNNASFLKQSFEFLDLPNPMYQGSLTVEKRMDREYEVEFRGVSFQYPGSESFALKNVNVKFRVGERLAVVGENGSGKTTFIKLLTRLYDPTEGQILLNGIDIRKYSYLEYMSIFSVVFQDFMLFAFPLGQNVAAETECDSKKVRECLEKAGFGERLFTMPDGIHTYLYKHFSKEGVDISGGEAQKIALARCLYKDAPFMILDEPTAALDPIAEAEVYTRFNEYVGDKTAIYISHRLSSCRFCDEIAVFDSGQIVQLGCHEQLVKEKQGKYFELWQAQAQYYTG